MSRTVDPTEIRDTTDRLAQQLARPRPGVLRAGDARRAGHPGRADRTARARAQDPGRRPRRGVRGVAGRRRPHRRRTGWPASTGTSKADAGRLVETGRQLEALPTVAGAVTRGELSARQAEAIAGAAAADPGAQRRLLSKAKDGSLRELQDECRRTRVNAETRPRGRPPAGARQAVLPDLDRRRWGHRAPAPLGARRRGGEGRQRHPPPRRQPLPPGPGRGPARTVGGLRLRRRRPAPDLQPVTASPSPRVPTPRSSSASTTPPCAAATASRVRPVRSPGSGPSPSPPCGNGWATPSSPPCSPKATTSRRWSHLGRRFTATQRTALQWQNPICARKGCANRLGLEYDHFDDWATTHTTRVEAAKRFCHPCHQLKSRGWRVSQPDEHGECTFTPPDLNAVADAAATAVQARRRRHPNHRTRSPTPRHRVAARVDRAPIGITAG